MSQNLKLIPEFKNSYRQYILKTTKGDPRCPTYTIEDIFEERTYFGKKAQEAIDLVTFEEDTLPVGSAKFLVHKYPSDIDVFENLRGCCTLNKVRTEVIDELRSIITRVLSNPKYIFADFKAGYDKRYKFYVGMERMGKIIDYDQRLALLKVKNLKAQGLINNRKYEEFKTLLPRIMNIDTFQKLNEYMRSFYVVRWTADELLQGFKDLRNNYRMYLFDALVDKSVVKLDLWVSLPYEFLDEECFKKQKQALNLKTSERFVEVTNWILIQYEDLDGDVKTLTQDLPNYASSLKGDVYKYTDPEHPKWLKATKRFWSYLIFKQRELIQREKSPKKDRKARRYNDSKDALDDKGYVEKLLVEIAPLFGSYISLINAIYGDLEVVKDIIDKDEDTKSSQSGEVLYMDKYLYEQTMKSLRLRLRCSTDLCLENKEIAKTLDKALYMLQESYGNMEFLDSVLEWLLETINLNTKKYLQDRNINIRKIMFER
jgi:hypothetical protein